MTDYFKPRERNILFRRIETITPEMLSVGKTVNGHQLLGHFNQHLRDLCRDTVTVKRSALFYLTIGKLGKWLVFYVTPWPAMMPKSALQVEKFIGAIPLTSFANDHATFISLLQQFESLCQRNAMQPHPVYGNLLQSEWGQYIFLFLDFYLTAFGIHGDYRAPK
jgi:hypothetical protein